MGYHRYKRVTSFRNCCKMFIHSGSLIRLRHTAILNSKFSFIPSSRAVSTTLLDSCIVFKFSVFIDFIELVWSHEKSMAYHGLPCVT